MDDACFVRRLQARGQLACEMDRARHRQLAVAPQHRREVCALDVRHRDVLDAVDLAEVVDADDVLVGDLARENQLAA